MTTDTVTSLHPTWCTLAPADDVTAAGRLRLQLQPAARRATLVPDEPGCIDAGACRCGHCTPPSTTLCLPVTPAPRPIPNSNPDLRTAAGMGWFGNEFAGAVRHALNWGVLRACRRSSRRNSAGIRSRPPTMALFNDRTRLETFAEEIIGAASRTFQVQSLDVSLSRRMSDVFTRLTIR